MSKWQYLLLMIPAVCVLLLVVLSYVRKFRLRQERDFTRRIETLLLPKEEIKTVCPGKNGRWILTSQRLILEAGEGFTAFPFQKIKKVSGVDETGKATVAAGKMTVLTVKTEDREFILHRKGENFTEFVKGLKAGVSRAKPGKRK